MDMQVYKEQLALYKAQLTPSQKTALMEERIKKKASRELKRKKKVSISSIISLCVCMLLINQTFSYLYTRWRSSRENWKTYFKTCNLPL